MSMRCDQHFYDEIRRQTTLEGAGTVLAEAALALGWDLAGFHAHILATELPRARSGRFIAEIMGWPSECLSSWRHSGLGRHCPVASLCGRVANPFYWTCDSREAQWFDNELTVEQRMVMEHYGRYVVEGFAVPVRLGNGGTGYVSWCGREDVGRERAQAQLGSMFFISHTFIRHAECLLDEEIQDQASARLTVRERECLTWAARGKNEEEIAALIHRSRDTVHFHLRNAALKLDAGNRTHAVAIACTRGLISLR
jgi:DNA-binding CsgD family transcriptional regulator